MKVTVLGCGTSTGVPRVGNDWGECDPTNPKNRRTRSSLLVEHDGFALLIDTGPDLRQQLLDNAIDSVQAVIWTHDHADHCHGIDDLRQLFYLLRRPVAGFASPTTMESLRRRFGYVFSGNDGYPATATLSELEGEASIGPFNVQSTEQPHGPTCSTGLRISAGEASIGYAIDFSAITPEMLALYSDVDLLITDCLRDHPHPTHAHTDLALQLISQTASKTALLTHMDKSMDYETVAAMVPPHIRPAYDGWTQTL